MNKLSDEERLARLRLFRSETVGPITFYRLLSRFGNAVKALEMLPVLAKRGGRANPPRVMTVQEGSGEVQRLQDYGGRMIVYGDEDYPDWLSTIEDAPPVLSILGSHEPLMTPSVAIVGSRNASANAKRFTHHLAQELGQRGQVIVSGLARGIDTMAHQGSIETGTVAVLAGGIDQIYPPENDRLYAAIAAQGCIVTEMPFGTAPTAQHFPKRNRIVSGLAKGVVIVEASLKSGSLITARLAAEQGREVFAVPGFPGDPRAAGPNQLIQNGAKLVQTAEDILEELMTLNQGSKGGMQGHTDLFEGIAEEVTEDYENTPNPLQNAHEVIMQNLSSVPTGIDDLARSCHLSIQMIQTTLLDLELAGMVNRHAGNRVSRAV